MKTIALTMIVKNEARSLARCLDSVAPWVDKMIVLDTGSTDDTIAIARAHGAEVYERRWTNDFAAARNAALARSQEVNYRAAIEGNASSFGAKAADAGLNGVTPRNIYLIRPNP